MRKINTGDVFKMARLLRKGNVAETVRKAYIDGKKEGADSEEIGMNAIFDILCSCTDPSIEDQFCDLLAGICEKKKEEISNQSLETTVNDMKRICEENNIVNFFRSASALSGKIQA